jgi:hypothetical protein
VAQREEMRGKTIVVIFPSSGERYFQHPMFDRLKEEAKQVLFSS